jgi:Flp pilus assembly protein TadG
MMRVHDERGAVTLWVLGLILPMMLLAGLSLDLWRGFSERRALAGIADAAAVAGANGLDTDRVYASNEIRLDPALAEDLARANLAAQLDDRSLRDWEVDATEDSVRVRLAGSVDLTLLRLFYDGSWDVAVTATARPQPLP